MKPHHHLDAATLIDRHVDALPTAFAAVVSAFVAIILDLIGKIGGTPDFSNYTPHGIHVGAWLTALVSFLIIAAVVYFFIVKPYEAAKARWGKAPEEEAIAEEVVLLREIRDALRGRA